MTTSKKLQKIKITGIIATASRYNRIQFELVGDDGKLSPIVYPASRGGDDEDSLAVESSVFQLAQAIYLASTERFAMAQLYLDNRCCPCSGRVVVEGVSKLSPAS